MIFTNEYMNETKAWAGWDPALATAGDILIDCAMYEYQTFYWLSNSLLDIKHFTGYQTVYWVSNSLLGIKQFTRYQTVYWISISLLNIKISIGLKSLNFFNILCPCDILIRNFIGPPGMLIGDFIVSYTSWFRILPQFFRNLTGTFLSRYML